jgi:hypothetical protein
MISRRSVAVLVALVLARPGVGLACSLCEGLQRQTPTFRQEAAQPTARMIVYGTIENREGKVASDLRVKAVVRPDPFLKGKATLGLPRYVPGDAKDPPRYLVFCDLDKGKIDPYRGVPVKGDGAVEYLKKALALDPRDAAANLSFFFRYLDHADPEVSRDAFMEFAKANDRDIARAAPRLSADKLRGWIADAKTPPERLSVYALLLGACGKPADAAFLRGLLGGKEERYRKASDGLLGGYMQLKPREGWELALALLRDGRQPMLLRLAVVRTVRYYHGAHPRESHANVLKAMEALLAEGELADIAVEDLRRWGVWDLTARVLGLYGKKGYDAPLMQRAIVRYALCCKPTDGSKAFLARLRAADAELVKEVEESLKLERGP